MNGQSHYHFNETITGEYTLVKQWVKEIFMKLNLCEQDAEIVADSLVDADARGVYSHGIQRVSMYAGRILKDCVNTSAKPYIIVDNDATAVVDGDNAMGQVVGVYAMNLAIQKAKQYGVSFVTARGSNHYGRCEYYTRMALEADMIGISSTVGGGNLMAPWGGTQAKVGNNPFSIAMPAEKELPVVLDMAQSVVAKGKIEMARKTHSKIPTQWCLDKDGLPTDDPIAALGGTLRPIADYKGSGIAIMTGFMSSMLSGGAVGPTLKDVYKDFDGGINKGQLFMAIDIGHLIDVQEFKKRMDEQVAFIKDGPLAANSNAVYLPGEMEYRNFKKQEEQGITYAVEIIEEIKELCRTIGSDIPDWV